VYSTGCLLYELLTQQPPFTGDSPVAVAYQHVREDPTLPSVLNSDVEPATEAVVMKAMAKNPGNRYQTAAEMRDDVLRAASGRAVKATPILSAADTTLLTPAASTAVLTPVGEERPGRRGWAYAALAVATVLVFLLSMLVVKSLFSGGGEQVSVPDVRGKTVAQARAILQQYQLKVGNVTEAFSTKPPGQVIDQDPLPKFSARSGGSVDLVVSKGVERVQVPDVVGQSLEDAKAELESKGLKVGTVTEKEQVGPPGRVMASDPAANTTVDKGSVVNLTVISGKLTVPDLFGKTFEEARSALEALGFSNVVKQDVPTDNPDEAGTVVGQTPAKGTKADRNAQITLQVAESASPSSSASPTPSDTGSPSASPSPSSSSPSP